MPHEFLLPERVRFLSLAAGEAQATRASSRQARTTSRLACTVSSTLRARAAAAVAIIARRRVQQAREQRSQYSSAMQALEQTNAALHDTNETLTLTLTALDRTTEDLRRSELDNFVLAEQLRASEDDLKRATSDRIVQLTG